jgi:hypothetical protein
MDPPHPLMEGHVEAGKAILHLTALFSFYRLPISMREYNVVRENPIFQIFYILS